MISKKTIKMYKNKILNLIVLLLFTLNTAFSQWNQTAGLVGVNCQRFVNLGNTTFVGTNANGIWKSTDGGLSWTQCNNGLNPNTDYSITELAILGSNTIIAATYDNGVFKSNDNGANWTNITGTLPASTTFPVTAITANSTMIIAGVESQGIYYSIDSGTTWTQANSGWTTNMFYRQLLIVGSDVYACTQDGVFKSSISSFLWTSVTNGLPGLPPSIRRIYNDNNTLYLGTSTNGIYRSIDHAANWTSLNTTLTQGFRVSSILEKNDTLYFASNGAANNVYMSPKNTINWSLVATGLASSANDIIFSNSNLLAATGADGPYIFSSITSNIDENTSSNLQINIYPNPFSSQSTIIFSQLQVNTAVKLFDIQGNEIKSINFSGTKLIIEKEQLVNGLYFIKTIDNNNAVVNKKIIVE